WPDVTPPGWNGPLEYTVGMVEKIDGQWYGSAAIEFWRDADPLGGNVGSDIVAKGPCTTFGIGSSCQVAKNWYYDGRWGKLAGYLRDAGVGVLETPLRDAHARGVELSPEGRVVLAELALEASCRERERACPVDRRRAWVPLQEGPELAHQRRDGAGLASCPPE